MILIKKIFILLLLIPNFVNSQSKIDLAFYNKINNTRKNETNGGIKKINNFFDKGDFYKLRKFLDKKTKDNPIKQKNIVYIISYAENNYLRAFSYFKNKGYESSISYCHNANYYFNKNIETINNELISLQRNYKIGKFKTMVNRINVLSLLKKAENILNNKGSLNLNKEGLMHYSKSYIEDAIYILYKNIDNTNFDDFFNDYNKYFYNYFFSEFKELNNDYEDNHFNSLLSDLITLCNKTSIKSINKSFIEKSINILNSYAIYLIKKRHTINNTLLDNIYRYNKQYNNVVNLDALNENISDYYANINNIEKALFYIKKTNNLVKIEKYKSILHQKIITKTLDECHYYFKSYISNNDEYLSNSWSGSLRERLERRANREAYYNEQIINDIQLIKKSISALDINNDKDLKVLYHFFKETSRTIRFRRKSTIGTDFFLKNEAKMNLMLNGNIKEYGLSPYILANYEMLKTPQDAIKAIDNLLNDYPNNIDKDRWLELKSKYQSLVLLDKEIMIDLNSNRKNIFEKLDLIEKWFKYSGRNDEVSLTYFKNHPNRNLLFNKKSKLKEELEILLNVSVNSHYYLTLDEGLKERIQKEKNRRLEIIRNIEDRERRRAKAISWLKDTFIPKGDYSNSSSSNNERPCYTILDKSTNPLSGTIKYEVRCKNGKTEIISYYPSKGKYSTTLLSAAFHVNRTFKDAIKDYCKCSD